ncbi:putative kinesin [Trypanosoma cruzi]|uniref:Kinesin, putative n=2 Tax=Trypanosoma cruzi TaxID=5693 RepID=Q4E0R3_TRYCC|nr:kinesin, putative [Trypanosoma cruzi]EAN98340.1 kinesin, putative [Trypanosoma cruzi]PWV13312.1 putative kinesin [Trypanosoma cruzi]|eukprot:XP_820191.1 kinesin [Trypanosoma cruzi strain CL Brener]
MGSGGDMAVTFTAEKKDTGEEEVAANMPEHKERSAVRVIVRVRPLSTVEHADPSVKNVLQCLKDGIVVHCVLNRSSSRYFGARHAQPRPQYFKVDEVFHPYSTQIEVYESCRSIVAGVFDGINGSILAYGATGSGKTHTMFGGSMSAAGVIYQAMQDILEERERLEVEDQKVVTVRCTFLEVYNEEVFDLLVPSNPHGKRTPLKVQDFGQDDGIKDGGKSGPNPESLIVKGLTQVTPQTAEEFAKFVENGHANRFVASTVANAHSSRSHAILTVEVEVKDIVNASVGTVGRVRFCDLAGSERAAGTTNSGIRLQEGGNINRSLLALGAVVQALAHRKKFPNQSNYIPYRGSKLTRLLRDCLGGNCCTLMLFCVSPSSMMYEETVNTMLFAMRAKEIQFFATRHEFRANPKEVAKNQEALIEDLRFELAQAREELQRLRGCSPGANFNRGLWSRQNSQAPVDPPSPEQFASPSKGDTLILFPATTVGRGTDVRTEISDASPGQTQYASRFSTRMTLTSEGSDAYTELQKKLKRFSVAKEQLYREMRDAQEANSELDIRLRKHKWKLARFLSTRRKNASGDTNGERMMPVGVAGLRIAIEKMEVESVEQGGKMERLLEKMNETDRTIAGICKELLREKQHPLLELLMDKVRVQQSCTEAECLAAHYHQECRSIMNREEEYAQALSVCVSVIRHMLPLASNVPAIREEAQLALMFANLPSLSTTDMISVFERSMHTGNVPSTSLLDSQRAFSFVETVEARLQRLVEDHEKRNPAARQPLQRRLQQQSKGTSSSKVFGRIASQGKGRTQMPTRPPRLGQETLFAQQGTTSLRQSASSESTARKKSLGFNSTASVNEKKVKFVEFTKNTVPIVPPQQPQRRNGSSKVNSVTRSTSRSMKAATMPAKFGRSHTATEALHINRPNTGSISPFLTRVNIQERFQKPRNSPSPNRAVPSRKDNDTKMPLRQNHVAFQVPDNGRALSVPHERLKKSDLEERFTRLLTEVQQWKNDNAAARSNHTPKKAANGNERRTMREARVIDYAHA